LTYDVIVKAAFLLVAVSRGGVARGDLEGIVSILAIVILIDDS
jgi:hypothetical protein